MNHRWLPAGLSLAGLFLLLSAGLFYPPDASESGVAVEEPERVVDARPGVQSLIRFAVRQPAGRAVRIVGLAEC
jgi:hypothetical protein